MLQIFKSSKGVVFAITILFLVYSCQKNLVSDETTLDQNSQSKQAQIDLAKNYYNQLIKEQGRDASNVESTRRLSGVKSATNLSPELSTPNRKYALFKKAYSSETSRSRIVEVPVVYDRRNSNVMLDRMAFKTTSVSDRRDIFKYSFDRLVIYTNKKTGKTAHRFISYIPDIRYLKKHNYKIDHNQINKLDSDFTGFIEHKNWDGTKLYYLQYLNGRRIKIFKTSVIKNTKITGKEYNKTSTNTSFGGFYCWSETIENWGMSCVSGDPEGADPECTPYLVSTDVMEFCEQIEEPDPCFTGDCDPDPCILTGTCETETPPSGPPELTTSQQAELAVLETSYLNSMSASERTIYNTFSPLLKYTYLINAHIASQEALSRYPGNQLNNHADAYRHAYFHALNSAGIVGQTLSAYMGVAHEDGTPSDRLIEKEMDLHNNSIGFAYATTHAPGQSIFDYLDDKMINGELWYLDPLNANGHIIPGITVIKNSNQ